LYTAFFCLARNSPCTPIGDYIETLFRFLYDFSFPATIFIPNSSVFPIEAFFYLRQFWTHESDKQTVERATSYFIAALVMANVAYMGYLVYFYSDKRSSTKPPTLLTNIMHHHILWSSGPLVVPYTSIMLTYITCDARVAWSSTCSVIGVSTAEFVFFSIILIVHNGLAVLYKVSVYDWSPYSALPAAKVHSRVCIVATPLRSLVTVIFGLFQYSQDSVTSYALAIVCIVYQAILTFSFWYEQPFQTHFINNVHVGIYAVACMASCSVLFGLLSGGTGDVPVGGIFMVSTILMLPTVLKMSDWRWNFVSDAPLNALKTATDVELRVRTELSKLIAVQENSDMDDLGVKADARDLERVLIHFKYPLRYSFKFNSIWATYLFLFKSNKFLAMQKLRAILDHSPMVLDILPLQIRLRFFAESASTEEINEPCVRNRERRGRGNTPYRLQQLHCDYQRGEGEPGRNT
jgi:hypothetical protein